MRPVFVAWCAAHGIPGWLVPDYISLAGLSALCAAAITLRLARREGADLYRESRTLALAYVAVLLGGYVFEALRMVPAAIMLGSLSPLLHVGRAAYGGLLGGMAAAALYLAYHRLPLGPFFDRISVGCGIAFFLVRIGCFLAGCDYGVPTQLSVGVRFPPGSLAAIEHARMGWVATGSASLPVHPTQLYESALGLVSAGIALCLLQNGHRQGRVFLLWLALYASGRLLIDFLRGDAERGVYLGLSTAQYVSVAVLVGIAALSTWRDFSRPFLVRDEA